jgi:hypothetical protein
MTRTRATLVFFALTMTFLISPFVAVRAGLKNLNETISGVSA